MADTEAADGYNPGPSSVSGGKNNQADGTWGSVSGGENNKANAPGASVSGGEDDAAGDGELGKGHSVASVSGGYKNTAEGADSSILGGKEITLNTEFVLWPEAP